MTAADPTPALREPAHRVCPRAIGFWRVSALIGAVIVWALLGIGYAVGPDLPWWALIAMGVLAAFMLVRVLVMPGFRYRVHRWEVTPIAVFTRSGWLSREERIAPLSRVQTVDSHQGAMMRLFRLASITVTTASAAGPLQIDCLDQDDARRVVAELTEITGASEGDAT